MTYFDLSKGITNFQKSFIVIPLWQSRLIFDPNIK